VGLGVVAGKEAEGLGDGSGVEKDGCCRCGQQRCRCLVVICP
jgi:hypothetical protein